MTVKVYLNDGSIEEYPNAHIYWEWDDNEEGTDSGFRISSMDKRFTTATAFVYPSECTKIEITSEECDRVFKSPPREDIIPVKRWKIFRAIHEEHIRQDEKWGEQNHPMRGISDNHIITRENIPYPEDSALRRTLATSRYRNETNKGGWFDILQEEVCEAFLETDPAKQREEMTQVAAVVVQIIECLDRKMNTEVPM